jgi:hypothetical protein
LLYCSGFRLLSAAAFATQSTLSNKIHFIKKASMRPLIALLTAAAFVAAPLVYAQQATPSPSPSAATAPVKKHRKKSAPATTAATPASTATPATAPAASPAPKKTSKAVPTPQATQAPGGGNGQVWVNSETHVYHKEGSKWYGKTKHGKYESEQDAIKEGDHAAKNEKP